MLWASVMRYRGPLGRFDFRNRVRTVLVIEDDAAVREAWAPDVIVLALVMPRMDGWEFLRRFRALPGQERTPVLLLTATASTGAALAGAQAILRKPFVLEALLRQVSDLAG